MLADFHITSPAAISCSELHKHSDGVFEWTVIFLIIVNIALLCVAFFLYQQIQSRDPLMSSGVGAAEGYNDVTGYNEL